jgi:hypothetical protein
MVWRENSQLESGEISFSSLIQFRTKSDWLCPFI